jgi:uncharacterized membrane protein YoaK (UPF0700 family)
MTAPTTLERRTVRALVLLTFTAGMIDAVAFLGLEAVFAANMTGNLAVLGFAIAGAPSFEIGGPVIALAAFLVGAAALGRYDQGTESRSERIRRLLWIEIGALIVAMVVAIGFETDDRLRRIMITILLAAAMGARNESVRRINVPELRTTVVTLAIAGYAAHEGEGRGGWGDRLRLAGILAMVGGAAASAFLVLNVALVWALAAITAVEVAALVVMSRSPAEHPASVGAS